MIQSLIQTNHLTTKIRPWVDAAIEAWPSEDNVSWELAVMPTPGPGGQPQPTLFLMAWIPSPILGQPIGGMCPIENPLGLDQETVNDLIPSFLRHLVEQRSQILESQGQPQQDVTAHLGGGR